MADFIRYGIRDGVATIELARPEKRNALSADMFTELGDAAEAAEADPDARAVVVRGAGPSFCAGIDVALLGELAGIRGPRLRSFIRAAQRPFLTLARMETPTVAAVQGHAVGAGFQLALACDLRVCAEDVRMAMLEVRFGLIPDLGGLHRLSRLLGPGRAKELVWTGRAVEADEAQRLGLANRVVATDTIAKEAEALARELAGAAPIPVGLAKALIERAGETPLETALEHDAAAQAACLGSEDHREAVAASLENRPPRFRGR